MTKKERKLDKGGERKMEGVCFCIPVPPALSPSSKVRNRCVADRICHSLPLQLIYRLSGSFLLLPFICQGAPCHPHSMCMCCTALQSCLPILAAIDKLLSWNKFWILLARFVILFLFNIFSTRHMLVCFCFLIPYVTMKVLTFNSTRPHCNKNSIYIFPENELSGLSPNFHIHVSVSDLHVYIPKIDPPIFMQRAE